MKNPGGFWCGRWDFFAAVESVSSACASRGASAPRRKAVAAASDRPQDGRLALQVPSINIQKYRTTRKGWFCIFGAADGT